MANDDILVPACSTALLSGIWNRATAQAHPIPWELVQELTVGDPSFRDDDLLYEVVGHQLAGFAVAKRLRSAFPSCEPFKSIGYLAALAVDPPFWGRGIGTRLLARAESHLRKEGVRQIAIGGSFHHAVPGIPDSAVGAAAFLARHGYQVGPGRVWDVARDVSASRLPTSVDRIMAKSGVKGSLLTVANSMSHDPVETAALLEFLVAEFPGRWYRDIASALCRHDAETQVMTLFDPDTVVGFAQLHAPGTPGTFRWWGFDTEAAAIGPVGIARRRQGEGLGSSLVSLAVDHLKRLGCRRVIIDWTDRLSFYGKLGFEPWLSYVLAQKTL